MSRRRQRKAQPSSAASRKQGQRPGGQESTEQYRQSLGAPEGSDRAIQRAMEQVAATAAKAVEEWARSEGAGQIRKQLADPSAFEDLQQELAARWLKLECVPEKGQAYLQRCARNLVADLFRKASRRAQVIHLADPSQLPEPPTPTQDPHLEELAADLHARLSEEDAGLLLSWAGEEGLEGLASQRACCTRTLRRRVKCLLMHLRSDPDFRLVWGT
jgi:DNA-directed RNA polymerase specialized sigma24 family protein